MKYADRRPRWALDVEALVALDMTLLGRRLVAGEFAIGVVGAGLLGILSVRAGLSSPGHGLNWSFWLGVELVFIGLNYLPLFLLSLRSLGDETLMAGARQFLADHPARARSFGLLQAWLLVPLAVVVFALLPPARPRLEPRSPEPEPEGDDPHPPDPDANLHTRTGSAGLS